ncbi:MAG: hypothetical protein WCA49_09775 [Candidatus Sulfotelmatobacter sp.]
MAAAEKLARRAPWWKTLLKDYLPVLTPVAALILSYVVYHYTAEFNKRASADASAETLGKLISEFEPATEEVKNTGEDDQEKRKKALVRAMKLAVYGERALPAVKMVLGADEDSVRSGGVYVVEQMYRSGTVGHEKLTSEMLSYYDDPTLRRGVADWLAEMGNQLSDEEVALFLSKLQQSFGADGQNCTKQHEEVALSVARFLFIRPIKGAKDLVLGMATNCVDSQNQPAPAAFQALETLPKIAVLLSKPGRDSVVATLRQIRSASRDAHFQAKADGAENDINTGK